jgi:lipopolysaccharide transport system ATP-binding protein
MNDDIVISLKNVYKSYKLFVSKTDRMKEALDPFKRKYHKEFYALKDLNLEVKRGEILGIVGMNGSGKSTLLKLISGIIPQTSGSVSVKGQIVPLLELGSGFNPEFSGMENIYFYNTIMGYNRKATDAMLEQIIGFAEIGDFIYQPLKTYSSGMRARLAFAVAVNIDPDILILDEVLSVGDELFRRKSFAKIEEFFRAGKTILFVSHSAQSVRQLCSRAIFLYNGTIVLDDSPKNVTMNYTKFLFSSPEQRQRFLTNASRLTTDSGTSIEMESELDLFGDKLSEQTNIVEPTATTSVRKKSEAYYLPNFIPKSTIITKSDDIEVTSVNLRTLDGDVVNCLIPGEEYYYGFTVTCISDIGHIRHGVGIKTTHGLVLNWRIAPNNRSYTDTYYKAGDVFEVKWRFYCRFIPDVYFMGLTIKREGFEGPEVIFRGSDMCVFKVMGERGFDRGGYIDLDFQLEP